MLHLVSPWKDYWTGWSLGSLKPELFEVNDYTRLQSDTMLCKKATKWTKMSETYTNRGQRVVTCPNLFRICNDHREGEKMNTVTGCKITTIQKGDPKGSQTGLFRWCVGGGGCYGGLFACLCPEAYCLIIRSCVSPFTAFYSTAFTQIIMLQSSVATLWLFGSPPNNHIIGVLCCSQHPLGCWNC